MKSIKSGFQVFLALWKNPKLKGIVQLVFWIIFFAFIAIIFRSANKNNDTKSVEEHKKEDSVNSYEYVYEYQDSINNIKITGTYSNEKEVFLFNNNKYYYIDNIYYDAITRQNANITYALGEWRYNSIKDLMDKNSYSNKTEYKDGNIKYEYTIDHLVYNSYYNTNYDTDLILNINEVNNHISEVTINYGFGQVKITYEKINEINNIDINID